MMTRHSPEYKARVLLEMLTSFKPGMRSPLLHMTTNLECAVYLLDSSFEKCYEKNRQGGYLVRLNLRALAWREGIDEKDVIDVSTLEMQHWYWQGHPYCSMCQALSWARRYKEI